MKYKEYTKEIWNQIDSVLEQLPEGKTHVAAFDADGTLWDTDLGENFFQYLIDNQLVPLPENPWQHYADLKASNPQAAYLWLAQICAGKDISDVDRWAKEALDGHKPFPIFLEQKKLIKKFLSRGVDVYIITASVTWAVQPGAIHMGVDPQNVLGVETHVHEDLVTAQQNGAITYRKGKVDALLARTGGIKPFFASGNTEGDFELLESATHLRLAVSAAAHDDRLYKKEMDLQKFADEKNWLRHRFIFGSES